MPLTPADYVKLLDQDLADATKAFKAAERLLLRSRLRMVHLATAVREADLSRPMFDKLRGISEDLKRAAGTGLTVPSMPTRTMAACKAGRHQGMKRGCLNGHCCACKCHRKRGKKKSKKNA